MIIKQRTLKKKLIILIKLSFILTNTLKIFAWQDLPDYWSDKVFKGIVVNQALPLRVIWNYIYRPVNERNQTQKNGNLPKVNIFEAFPVFLKKLSEIPQIYFLEEFPVFLSVSPIFRLDSGLYGSFIWGISQYFRCVSSFLGSVSGFQKKFKFSVCWSVSFFWGALFLIFFGSISGFQKNV